MPTDIIEEGLDVDNDHFVTLEFLGQESSMGIKPGEGVNKE